MDEKIIEKKISERPEKFVIPKMKLEKIDKAYSSEPWWYDLRGFLILTFAYRTTLPSQIRLFANHIEANHLEAAIGTGTLFEMIVKYRRFKKLPKVHVVGFDYAERMLAGARHRFKNEPQVELLRADAAQLPMQNQTFDSAAIANAIHCLPDISGALYEIHRVLKLGGTLTGNCLLEPKGNGFFDRLAKRINAWGIKKGILYRPYTQEQVMSLLKEVGFKIVKQEVSGNCLNFVAEK